jgi:glycosyltransferase involved in cell wall biosynthesis
VGVLRSLRGARRAFARELGGLDAVWLFGPYPVSLLFAWTALRRGKRVFLGVRQDFPAYIRNRLPGWRQRWAVWLARAFELVWRRLARRAPAVVVGEELGRRYPGSLATGFSLVRAADLVDPEEALARPWTGRVLTVGRLDPEKNPLLLPEIVARLRARGDDRWRLVVVGQGPLEQAVGRRAEGLGVAGAVELRGYVPNGPDLWRLYREANAFLHVSFTEGLPQVLWEAQAAGTPIVGTAVGGVPAALGDGERGLLIPPGDADAAVAALERLRDEDELRRGLAARGLDAASRETIDAQVERILRFFSSSST